MYFRNYVQCTLCFIFVALTFCAQATPTKTFSNVIIFGDSLSDIGNNYWQDGKAMDGGAPITNQKQKLAPSLTNAPLWIQQLIIKLKIADSHLTASKNIANKSISPFNQNVDYAWVSAETNNLYLNDLHDDDTTYPPYDPTCTQAMEKDQYHTCIPGELQQIHQYLTDLQGNQPNPKTLFILWAGANDLFNNISKLMSQNIHAKLPLNQIIDKIQSNFFTDTYRTTLPEKTFKNMTGSLSHPISNIETAIKTLHDQGVPLDNIYVINMPNLSNTPAGHTMAKGNPLILKAISLLSTSYNTLLQAKLTGLFTLKYHLAKQHIISAGDFFNRLVSGQDSITFKSQEGKTYTVMNDVSHDCLDDSDSSPNCCSVKEGKATCYLFYNDKHPTVYLSNYIADQAQAVIEEN